MREERSCTHSGGLSVEGGKGVGNGRGIHGTRRTSGPAPCPSHTHMTSRSIGQAFRQASVRQSRGKPSHG